MRAVPDGVLHRSLRVPVARPKQYRNPYSGNTTIQKSLYNANFRVFQKSFILMRAVPDGLLHGTRRMAPLGHLNFGIKSVQGLYRAV